MAARWRCSACLGGSDAQYGSWGATEQETGVSQRSPLQNAYSLRKNARILLANSKSAEMCVPHMPSLQAQKLGKLFREKYS